MAGPAIDERYIAFAGRLADAAGTAIRPHFRSRIAIDDKADASPVTVADRAAEAAMRDLIAAHFPDHGILGEELPSQRLDAPYVWVIDPIDGTRAFITGLPLFGTLIALLHEGRPVLGVIDQPILGERWIGAAGRGTTLNGAPVATRPCARLGDAYLFATAPTMFTGADAQAWDHLSARVKQVRYGADCYGYAMLASGFADLVVECDLKPFDYCALVPVIEGAGGRITDWRGAPLGLHSDGRVIAAGDPVLHDIARTVLAD